MLQQNDTFMQNIEWVQIININPRTDRPFGCQTLWASSDNSKPLGKQIKKIGISYPWSLSPGAILIGLVSYALVGSVALLFSL